MSGSLIADDGVVITYTVRGASSPTTTVPVPSSTTSTVPATTTTVGTTTTTTTSTTVVTPPTTIPVARPVPHPVVVQHPLPLTGAPITLEMSASFGLLLAGAVTALLARRRTGPARRARSTTL